jgi:hypothetical protein
MSFIGQVNSSGSEGSERCGASEFTWLLIDKVLILSGLIFSQKVKIRWLSKKR